MIKSEIINDSIDKNTGNRITTFILQYPRFVHAELMTHRVFSRNAASSRAIPVEKFIEDVKTNPAMPVYWGKNKKGMQATEEVNDISSCESVWLDARNAAINYAIKLKELGAHKQITNRLLEPWFHIRVLVTSTEYSNFFKLRCHIDAQPEIQDLAYKMLDCYTNSIPKELNAGEWHIPFGDKMDEDRISKLSTEIQSSKDEIKRRISIARCARISYLNFEGKDDYNSDLELCKNLFESDPKHLSPTEHVAMNMSDLNSYGNFKGWKQARQFLETQ